MTEEKPPSSSTTARPPVPPPNHLERKEAENLLERDRQQKLEKARQAAAVRDEEMSHFSAEDLDLRDTLRSVAHEVGGLVAVISTTTDLFIHYENLPKEVQDKIAQAGSSGKQLARLHEIFNTDSDLARRIFAHEPKDYDALEPVQKQLVDDLVAEAGLGQEEVEAAKKVVAQMSRKKIASWVLSAMVRQASRIRETIEEVKKSGEVTQKEFNEFADSCIRKSIRLAQLIPFIQAEVKGETYEPTRKAVPMGSTLEELRAGILQRVEIAGWEEAMQVLSAIDSQGVIRLDPGLIEVIAANLFRNARNYKKGFIGIEIAQQTVKDTDGFMIRIGNDGTPIPTAQLFDIFQKGIRGSNVLNAEGSGMGLYWVALAVRRLGGRISVGSGPMQKGVPGFGPKEAPEDAYTVFEVFLPFEACPLAADVEPAATFTLDATS